MRAFAARFEAIAARIFGQVFSTDYNWPVYLTLKLLIFNSISFDSHMRMSGDKQDINCTTEI